ncbi:hypothetical protein C8F01DRAFT_1371089 [Mycena amicta]|nr:hypothetical protein C8F01DRAFT_1371089 [Mycena amicta]
MTELDGPTLPPELERVIFELSAWNDRTTTLSLLLVARRVHIWIEPLLYRVLLISDLYVFPELVTLQPEHTRFIRHLALLWDVFEGRPDILPTYVNLTDLDLWGGAVGMEDFSAIQSLPNLPAWPIFQSISLPSSTLFGKVYPSIVPPLSTLPALTHLSFYNLYVPNVIRSSLVSCNTPLRFLVLIDGGNLCDDGDFDADTVETTIDDPRFVVVSCSDFEDDWLNGAWGGTDNWSRAEEIVAARPPKRE